jgi:hypothetical protein
MASGHKGMKVSMESVLFLSEFNTSTEMFSNFSKNPEHEIPCRSILFHASRQVDKWTAILKLMLAFHNYFVNTSRNWVTP